jgi:pilus assembly protein CpaB
MKVGRIVVLAVAVVAGLLAALLALNMTRQPARVVVNAPAPVAAPPPFQTADVLVAAQDIDLGKVIEEPMVKWEQWPAAGISDKLITQQKDPEGLTKAVGAIARSPILAGEPISDAKLIRTDSGVVSAMLPQGMRAVAIRTSADTSAGGLIQPNDHVDVIMSRPDPNAAAGGPAGFITETILSNVRVLAIDQTLDNTAVVGQTATLELTPKQAEILTVAQQITDRLALSLRSFADSGNAGPDADYLVDGTKPADSVTIVRGGRSREVGGMK